MHHLLELFEALAVLSMLLEDAISPAPHMWTHTPYSPVSLASSASIWLADAITHPKRVWCPYNRYHPHDYPELRKFFDVVDYMMLQQVTFTPQPRDALMMTLTLGNIPYSVGGTRVNTALMRSLLTYLGVEFHSMQEDHRRGHGRALFRVTLSPAEAEKLLALNGTVLFRPDFLLILNAYGSKNVLFDAVEIMRKNKVTRHGLMSIERQMPRPAHVEEA
ncbi:Hypothetical protein, putative [Bodo saltans]|uniref:RRM domain-containing protein n=1 Tax=Bodo saltans TaxID=75058 RepID=A0A0S4KLJ9_BODSA|nr:Hypothetical protein, putative [Bodo saltans]|eukprot:CUI14365.1 Hypothetical protein, putative [Bodo saltans]